MSQEEKFPQDDIDGVANTSTQPLMEDTITDDDARPPTWANASKAMGESTDSSESRRGRLAKECAILEDQNPEDDVFDGEKADNGDNGDATSKINLLNNVIAIHDPIMILKPKKRVRMFSGPAAGQQTEDSVRMRNMSGTEVPAWANASIDLDSAPKRYSRPPALTRQQSMPVVIRQYSTPASPRGWNTREHRQSWSPVFTRQESIYKQIDAPPVRRRKRSGVNSGLFYDPTWANQSREIGDVEEDAVVNHMAYIATAEHEIAIQVEDQEKQKLTKEDSIKEEEGEEEDGRAGWGGQMEFLFTMIGYAVGLGNVWRFPYLAYKNGGGAFLVPYVFMLLFVGLPLFFMELSLGQFASLGPITCWRFNPVLKGLGYAMVSVSWLIGLYYNVIISHVLLFLCASFASIGTELPWTGCDNYWNTPNCIRPNYNDTQYNVTINSTVVPTDAIIGVPATFTVPYNATLSTAAGLLNVTGSPKTASEEYYERFILEQSTGIDDMGHVNYKLCLCLLLAWVIVLVALLKGVQSLGKVVYFTAIFPYFMLTVLFIRGVTLPGAGAGISFYLTPDFSKLASPRVWCDAATQIFYSLSVCTGGMVAMSSYNKFNNNILRDSIIVAFINCGTSVYAGLVIFAILGFMAEEKGVSVQDVATGGPGLAFVVYPEALSRMPVPVLWAIFFFFMMLTLGFGSQFSIIECVLSALTDEFPKYLRGPRRSIVFRSIFIFSMFLLGIPMVTTGGIYLLNLVDYSVSGVPMLICGFCECAAINWIYTYDRFAYDIMLMIGKKPNMFWKVCWFGLTPFFIGMTFLFNCIYYSPPTLDDYSYPPWAESLGWLIQMFPIMLIIGYFLYYFMRNGGFTVLKKVVQPTSEWGPASAEDRKDTTYDPDYHEESTEYSDNDIPIAIVAGTGRPVSQSGEPIEPILKKNPQSFTIEDDPNENVTLLSQTKVRFGKGDEEVSIA